MNFFIIALCLLFLGVSCSHEEKGNQKDTSYLKAGQKMCLANLTIEGEEIEVQKDKELLSKCLYLKKLEIKFCHSSKDMMEAYHSSLFKNQAHVAKGDTIYYRSLIKPNQHGYLLGHVFRCKTEEDRKKEMKGKNK